MGFTSIADWDFVYNPNPLFCDCLCALVCLGVTQSYIAHVISY